MALAKKRKSSRNIKERMPMNINSLPDTMTAVQGAGNKQAHNVTALKKAKEAQELEGEAALKLIDSAKTPPKSNDPMRGQRINLFA